MNRVDYIRLSKEILIHPLFDLKINNRLAKRGKCSSGHFSGLHDPCNKTSRQIACPRELPDEPFHCLRTNRTRRQAERYSASLQEKAPSSPFEGLPSEQERLFSRAPPLPFFSLLAEKIVRYSDREVFAMAYSHSSRISVPWLVHQH